jgi:hypothetical protein
VTVPLTAHKDISRGLHSCRIREMAALRPLSTVESFVEELLVAGMNPLPSPEPSDGTHRFYACFPKKENPGVEECVKGSEKDVHERLLKRVVVGPATAAVEGKIVSIGRQWPEILDQVVLAQKMKKKVALLY